jgi:DNA-binding Xre family transcriptional regulator
LIRDCLRSHLFDPRTVSYSNVMIQIEITHKKLSELAKDAPTLRCQHLLDLCKAVDDRGDTAWSTIILEILTREQERKQWCCINYTT